MEKKPILVVDDEPVNLAAMRQILAPEHRLVFARSGAEALTAAARTQPSLILLDIRMEDMDGYQVCRQLKMDPATESIPVIFVTRLTDIGNEAEGFEAGAVDYITKPVSSSIVRARVRNQLSLVKASMLERSHRDAISMLAEAGNYNDNDTGAHIWRMAAYASELAEAYGWSKEDCDILEAAAPMHDMGKIGIPGRILRKPGKLTDEERSIMQTHTRIGHRILSQSEAPVFRLAAVIALHHHERWDGTGYPDGLAGLAIPEAARIVAVADVFDALGMKRSYKEAWPMDKILSTIKTGSGTHFEPRLVEIFCDRLPLLIEIGREWDVREAGRAADTDPAISTEYGDVR